MRVVIAGKRDFTDRTFVFQKLDEIFSQIGIPDEIIEGGASGVDTLANEYARIHAIPVRRMKAKWSLYGKAAGPIRNREMAQYAAEDANAHLVAFWDGVSKGTKNMIETAQTIGLTVHVESLI